MVYQADNDLLWTFCGVSVDYIFNVCCMETMGNVLSLKYRESLGSFFGGQEIDYYRRTSRALDNNLFEDSPLFFELLKKSAKEFYSLLSLDNLTYREQLQGEIFDYMRESESNSINLWGYFDFRLGRYLDLIDKAVSNTLNQYLETMDYERCLKIIGESIINSEHRVKILHVVFLASGGFLLLNENNEIMEADEINDEMGAAISLGLKLDDVLTAAFVYYAPQEIVVHNYCNAKNTVSSMVWDMAGANVVFCDGCGMCDKYRLPIFAEV